MKKLKLTGALFSFALSPFLPFIVGNHLHQRSFPRQKQHNATQDNTRPHTTQNKTLTIREGSIFSFQLNPMSLENNKKVPSNGNDSYP